MIDLLSSNESLYLSVVGLLGLLFGSFFNVVIHRVPKMLQQGWADQCRELLEINDGGSDPKPLSLTKPRSRCPQCGELIGTLQNIPLLSFVLLRGKCRHCARSIPFRYPLVESLTAISFVTVAWVLGFSYQAMVGIALTGLLIPLTFIDIDEQILPDSITIPGIWLGLLVNLFGTLTDLQSAVIGAMAGYGSLWIVYQAFKLFTGKEGMGYGDFKLLAMLGAWLGWQALPLVILLSATVGAVTGITILLLNRQAKDTPIPFGPYLCLAGWIALLKGHDITSAYLGFAGLG